MTANICPTCGVSYTVPFHVCTYNAYPGMSTVGSLTQVAPPMVELCYYPRPSKDISAEIEIDHLWDRFDALKKKIDHLTETLAELLKAMREVQCR